MPQFKLIAERVVPNQEVSRVLLSKEVQDDALTPGTQAGGEPPEEFAAFVRAEIRKWGKVIKDAGIRVEWSEGGDERVPAGLARSNAPQ
jgi:hypothetical protein